MKILSTALCFFFLVNCLFSQISGVSVIETNMICDGNNNVTPGSISIEITDVSFLPILIETISGPKEIPPSVHLGNPPYTIGPFGDLDCAGEYCFLLTSGAFTPSLEDDCFAEFCAEIKVCRREQYISISDGGGPPYVSGLVCDGYCKRRAVPGNLTGTNPVLRKNETEIKDPAQDDEAIQIVNETNRKVLVINNLKVYPNPFMNELFVELNSNQKSEYTFVLTDMLGRNILTSQHMGEIGINKFNVDLSNNLDKGIYFLTVINTNSQKIIGVKKLAH